MVIKILELPNINRFEISKSIICLFKNNNNYPYNHIYPRNGLLKEYILLIRNSKFIRSRYKFTINPFNSGGTSIPKGPSLLDYFKGDLATLKRVFQLKDCITKICNSSNKNRIMDIITD